MKLTIDRKSIARLRVTNRKDFVRLVGPLILWFGIVVMAIVVSWRLMISNIGNLYVLKMQSWEDVGISRLRFWTNELMTTSVYQNDDNYRTVARTQVGESADVSPT